MKTLNLTEMEGINGGQAGITCTLEGRVEYGGLRISTWSCSNGQNHDKLHCNERGRHVGLQL